MSKSRILIVDDDPDMVDLTRAALLREGYDAESVSEISKLPPAIRKYNPDVILLDLVLPDGDGLDQIVSIRKITEAPIIVVSGKNDWVDKVVGLERGADDYLAKPFQIKELCARVKAQLRRNQSLKATQTGADRKLRFGEWTLDPASFQVLHDEGHSANLTVKEFKLLQALINAAGRVLSREQILDFAREDDVNVTDRAIDTQITRLRKKIGDEAGDARFIQAVRGAGYMFIATVSPA